MFAKKNRYVVAVLAAIASLLFIVLSIVHIYQAAGNIPFADDWKFLKFIHDAVNGHATLHAWFAPHNGHRYFILRLLLVTDAKLASLNYMLLMYLSVLITLLSVWLLFYMFRGYYKRDTWSALLVFLPITALMFSLRQWENWLMGMQVAIFLMILFVIACIHSLRKTALSNRYEWLWLFLAILTGLLATYSFGSGLMVWPIGVIYLFARKVGKNRIKLSIIYALAGLLIIIIYSRGLASDMDIRYLINHPAHSMAYFILTLGVSIVGEENNRTQLLLTGLIGIVMLCVYMYIFKKSVNEYSRGDHDWIDFLPYIFFSICSAMLITIGRAKYPLETACASRYSTVLMLGPVGVYMSLTANYKIPRVATLFTIVTALIAFFVISSTLEEYKMGIYRQVYVNNLQNMLAHTGSVTDEQLRAFDIDADTVRQGIVILKQEHWSYYSHGYDGG